MNDTNIQGLALVVMLLTLPLISWGTVSDIPTAAFTGAGLFAAASLSLTVIRFIDFDADKEET